MKYRLGASLFLTLLAILVIAGRGVAQDYAYSSPVPPAFGVGERIRGEAYAARDYANLLDANHKGAEAAIQRQISHNRAVQAVQLYRTVAASATFGHTPYAGDALYYEGQLQEQILKDQDAAIQAYKNLLNNYSTLSYRNSVNAPIVLDQLQKAADQKHSREIPYKILDFLVKVTGRKSYSYFLAILMVSIIVKLVLTPLSNKQYASMKQMQRLTPLVNEVKAKYKDDKAAQGAKVMELYGEHGINPLAGCLPMVVQFPVLIGLYYTIRTYEYQFRHGTFLWIGSPLSHMHPSFMGIDLGQPDIPILVLYAASMYITQKMMVTPDPQQAEQQKAMAAMIPFVTFFMFLQYKLPSAFILYYLIFNILSTLQQQYYMKKRTKEDVAAGAVVPAGGFSSSDLSFMKTETGGSNRSGRTGGSNGVDHAGMNGSKPASRGAIAPKVHPKKKRR